MATKHPTGPLDEEPEGALALATSGDDDQAEPTDGEEAEPPADEGEGEEKIDYKAIHKKLLRWADVQKSPNIAMEIADQEGGDQILAALGLQVIREFEIDERSREHWLEQSKVAMDLAMQVTKAKTFPWDNASNIIYPLMTSAAIQFAARAYPAIVANNKVVIGQIEGPDAGVPVIDPATGKQAQQPPGMGHNGGPVWEVEPGIKQARADRIGQHMSWQLLEEQEEWEEDTDKLLHILPIVGCDFRKTYFDPIEGLNISTRVGAADVVINYWAPSMARAPRISEKVKFYPTEIDSEQRKGIFVIDDYGVATNGGDDPDAPHDFVEQYRRADLDEDGYSEPYIVTVHKESGRVARIVANYDAESIHVSTTSGRVLRVDPVAYYTKYDFLPNPDGGIYGVGFGQILMPINEAINSTLNMLMDSGTLANTGGGFIGKGFSMHGGSVRFKPGEWKTATAMGSTIRDAMVPLVHPAPSDVLFKLLGLLIQSGKEVASNTEVLAGNQTHGNVPATTTLALIEQGLKVFTAIYKRIHRSLKSEFKKLYRLNRIYLQKETSYRVGADWKQITQADYEAGAGVIPASDPTMVSEMQMLGRAAVLEKYINDPLFDGVEIRKRILAAANIDGADKMLHPDPLTNPMLFFKRKEIELEEIKIKSMGIYHMARGVLALAMGDKAVGDKHLDWMDAHLAMLQNDMENGLSAFSQPDPRGDATALDQPPPVPPEGDPPNVGATRTPGTNIGFGGA